MRTSHFFLVGLFSSLASLMSVAACSSDAPALGSENDADASASVVDGSIARDGASTKEAGTSSDAGTTTVDAAPPPPPVSCYGGVACPSGCCGADEICLSGNDDKACGTNGQCVDCGGKVSGNACVAGSCGCNSAADCASQYQSCDLATHTCVRSCSATQPCNAGCCVDGICGSEESDGGNACANDPKGKACIAGKVGCGCTSTAGCPENSACDLVTHECTSACSATQPCNGGCCDGTTCQSGAADDSCGQDVGTTPISCTTCSATLVGGHCGDGRCGNCANDSDCNGPAGCRAGRCCLPTGSKTSNPGDCCSVVTDDGMCQ